MPFSEIPEVVRRRAIAANAQEWLDGLPKLISDLEREWSIAVGRVFEGGSEALVAEATLADGSPAILKLLLQERGHEVTNEIAVLRLAAGNGCARLLNADEPRSAMLLERLGRPVGQLGLPAEERLDILCVTAQRLWRPVERGAFQTGAEKARWLIEFTQAKWEELNRPCSAAAAKYAVACAEAREAAHDDTRAVLVHGDIHEDNTLEDGRGGYKLIDPDGLFAEPEYDLGVITRAEPLGADPRRHARRLAAMTGLDETATWEWAAAERMSTALVCRRLRLEPFAENLFRNAEEAAQLPR